MLYGSADEVGPGAPTLIVARVSSKEQAKDDKLSLLQQVERLRGICDKRDWEIVAEIQIGASAAKADSDYFKAMDDAIAKHNAKVVLFAGVDRFCRDFMEGVTRLYRWPKEGVNVYFGERRFDPENPDDVCMNLVMLAFSNHKKAKNQKAAQQKSEYARLRGRVYLRSLPVGYRWGESRTLEHDENAPLIAEIWRHAHESGVDAAAKSPLALQVLQLSPQQRDGEEDFHEPEAVRGFLLDLIHHPLYGGEIPYSGTTYPWPDYAIGDQRLLADLRARHPRPSPGEGGKRVSNLETRMEKLVEAVGLTQFVSRVFRDGQVLCPDCHQPKRLNGHQVRGRYLVPQIGCGCVQGRPIFTQKDIDRFAPRLVCPQCGETDPLQLSVHGVGRDYLIRCGSCRWHTRVDRSPWAPKPKLDVQVDKPPASQQQLANFG